MGWGMAPMTTETKMLNMVHTEALYMDNNANVFQLIAADEKLVKLSDTEGNKWEISSDEFRRTFRAADEEAHDDWVEDGWIGSYLKDHDLPICGEKLGTYSFQKKLKPAAPQLVKKKPVRTVAKKPIKAVKEKKSKKQRIRELEVRVLRLETMLRMMVPKQKKIANS